MACLSVAAAENGIPYFGQGWLRIEIGDEEPGSTLEDGVYALAFEDASRASIRAEGVPMASLRIFTGPYDSIPVGNAEAGLAQHRLRSVPFWNNDRNQTFDSGDTLWFFAHGSSVWRRDSARLEALPQRFRVDPYSLRNVYYLVFDGASSPNPDPDVLSQTGTSNAAETAAPSYLRFEKDRGLRTCNPSRTEEGESGRIWHWHWRGDSEEGNCYYPSPRTLNATELRVDAQTGGLPAYAGGLVNIEVSALHAVHSESIPRVCRASCFEVFVDGRPLATGISSGDAPVYQLDTVPMPQAFRIDSIQWSSGLIFEGYTVAYQRRLSLSEGAFRFFPARSGQVSYRVSGGPLRVLKLREGIPTAITGWGDAIVFQDSVGEGESISYWVMGPSDRRPVAPTALRWEVSPGAEAGSAEAILALRGAATPEYLILTSRTLLSQALQLAAFRRDPSRLRPWDTRVAMVEDIYRLFSGGRLSPPALRDFIRKVHDNSKVSGKARLQHVLLFGDGHFNYRELPLILAGSLRLEFPENHVPPFEAWKYATDDFYALLDSTDALFDNSQSKPDVGIGRIPAGDPVEAEAYLTKIREYESPENAGSWRNRIVLAADDDMQRDKKDGIEVHTEQSEQAAQTILRGQPGHEIEKIYLLDYERNASFAKPTANQDLLGRINRGCLLVNYFGHGAPIAWADEGLLHGSSDLRKLSNSGRYTMLNAFSCTVGRYDQLTQDGISEIFLMAPEKGAIAAVSGTRESFATENNDLAQAFYGYLFDSSSAFPAGEALRLAKTALTSDAKNKVTYNLLGEPVLDITRGGLRPKLTTYPAQLQAVDCGVLEGEVLGGSGSGGIRVSIQGDEERRYLQSVFGGDSAWYRGQLLFEGEAEYHSGRFRLPYVFPKRIPFGDSLASIRLYAWDVAAGDDGAVALGSLRVGGVANTCPEDDGRGPVIKITGCDAETGGKIDFPDEVSLSLPYCLEIQVSDTLGGVLGSELPDEGTVVEIPGARQPFHPNPRINEAYFKSYSMLLERGSFTPGRRLLKVSAQDGFGNRSIRTLTMQVSDDSTLNLVRAFNVPNPLKRGNTVFYFSLAAPTDPGYLGDGLGSRYSYELRLFDQRGQLVRRFTDARSGVTSWDGRDAWGNLLANGIYYYKAIAVQERDALGQSSGKAVSKRNVLVISR